MKYSRYSHILCNFPQLWHYCTCAWENKAPATGHPHVNAGRNHHGVGDPWRRVHQGTSVHSDVDPDQSWPIYVHLRAHPCSVGHGKSMATQFSKIWVASFVIVWDPVRLNIFEHVAWLWRQHHMLTQAFTVYTCLELFETRCARTA